MIKPMHPLLTLLFTASVFLSGCDEKEASAPVPEVVSPIAALPVKKTELKVIPASPPLVAAARRQIGKTVYYDPAYVGLDYPGGDVPLDRGVCTDVVIRALRDARKMDLQKLVHEDMSRAFSKYPAIWGLTKPDKNIDHRRVPNLMTYFQRRGYELRISKKTTDYLPGDIVTCNVGNRPHIMIVSDKKARSGTPRIIHNIGSGTKEEDRLFAFPITGHYRVQ